MLRFKVDENLPAEIVSLLNAAGHDSMSVTDQQLGGASDESVADACRRERRALITLDLDFADIRTYPPNDYAGLIVLRPKRAGKNVVLGAIRRLLPVLEDEPFDGKLWIVDETTVRIRE